MPTLSRPVTAFALTAALALTAGCGSDEPEATPPSTAPSTSSPAPATSAPAPSGKTQQVTFADGDVTPAGKKVGLKVGETLTLEVTAEAAGELHVHSSPEQTISFPAGESSHDVTLDRPGVYEVEAHHPHKLVLQLEVR